RGAARRPHRANHRPLRLETDLRHARPQRYGDRRQRRQSHRRHGRVDVRARRLLARSQLESGRHRSRTITPMPARCRAFCLLALLIGFSGETAVVPDAAAEPIKFRDSQYEPVDWADIDGWASDDHAAAFSTFLASCRVITTTKQRTDTGPIADGLKSICG